MWQAVGTVVAIVLAFFAGATYFRDSPEPVAILQIQVPQAGVEFVNRPGTGEWGVRVVKDMPLELVFEHLFKNELFRLSWGAKNARGEEWERLETEFEAVSWIRPARTSADIISLESPVSYRASRSKRPSPTQKA